jgi:hypothetical protein
MTFDKRFYGIYKGIVMDNVDPDSLGRVKVKVPQVTGDDVTDWADACSAGGGLMNPTPIYGAFSDYTTQSTTANTATAMRLNTVDEGYGIKVVSSTRITLSRAGTYNFQWSGQFQNTDTQLHDVSVWMRKNGVDIVGSTGLVSIPNTHGGVHGHSIAGWNYVMTGEEGDYYQFYWSTDDTKVTLQNYGTSTSPTRPSTASLIVTVTPVGNILPLPGESVWVMYIAGDPNFPVWMGVSK